MLLAGAADLLGVQADVIGVGEHLLECQPRLLEATARVSASTYQNGAPRRYPRRRAPRPGVCGSYRSTRQSDHQSFSMARQGGQPLGVGRRDELDHRHQQHGRVEVVCASVWVNGCRPWYQPRVHDSPVDLVARLRHASRSAGGRAGAPPDRPLHRHPAHQPGGGWTPSPGATTRLPHAPRRAVPVVASPSRRRAITSSPTGAVADARPVPVVVAGRSSP